MPTVAELKAALDRRGLDVGGKKAELEARLAAWACLAPPPGTSTGSSGDDSGTSAWLRVGDPVVLCRGASSRAVARGSLKPAVPGTVVQVSTAPAAADELEEPYQVRGEGGRLYWYGRDDVQKAPDSILWPVKADKHTCALRSRLSAAAGSSGHHSRHLLKAQVVHRQRCGGADSRSPRSTPLYARRTAAADAGGKEARQTRGRERRQYGTDRQRRGKEGSCGEGMAPTAAGGFVSARALYPQKPDSKAAAAHQQTAPAPAFACCRRRTRSSKMS
eukprot:COSAG01_NODE_3093_length_6594_cov_368.508237_2_plen_275_part_00